MAWIWVALILFLSGIGYMLLAHKFNSFTGKLKKLHEENLNARKTELEERENTLRQLAPAALGFADPEDLKHLMEKMEEAESVLQAARGKLTISRTELSAVESRLRELEELERELEASQVDARRELEMLQDQEKQFSTENEKLRIKVETAFSEMSKLVAELEGSKEACEQLIKAQAEIESARDKIEWYQEQIATLNTQFIELKNAYDALDIEYAQLYEKQSAL